MSSPLSGARQTYLPQLDALRGIACLMVLVAHLRAVRWLHWIPEALGVGGVGIFFVLSGFLITRLLIRDRADGKSLLGFYNRRVARIFPVFYVTLAVLAVVWPGKELVWAASFSFNFLFFANSRDYFQSDAAASAMPPIAHFWSLCVEEHFYWFWPIAMMRLPKKALCFLPVSIVLATPLIAYLLAKNLDAVGLSRAETDGLLSRLTLTQLAGISLGALFALYERPLSERLSTSLPAPIAPLLGSTLMAAGGLWVYVSASFPSAVQRAATGSALHVVCGGVFLVALATPILGRLRLLNFVGQISYGLYVYHLPIYAALGLTKVHQEASVITGAAALLLTLCCAVASYYCLERPIIARVRQWPEPGASPGSRHAAVLGTSFTLAATLLFVLSLAGTYRTTTALAHGHIASARETAKGSGPPAESLPAGRIKTLVVGSSHGALGFAAPECRELTYNLSLESQDLWYDCEIVKTRVPSLGGLERVVFCVSAFSFRYAISDTDSERWRETMYFRAGGIPSRSRTGQEQRFAPLVLANSLDQLAALQAKIEFVDEPLLGWRPKAGKILDISSGKAAALRHQKHGPQRIEQNRAQLVGTICMCQAAGIECILVSLPTHQCYREHLDETLRAETCRLVEQVSGQTHAQFLDYSADSRFADADFYDGDHLNESGARKFTRLFDREAPEARISRASATRSPE